MLRISSMEKSKGRRFEEANLPAPLEAGAAAGRKEAKKETLPEEFFRCALNRLQNSALAFGSLNLGAFVRLFCVQGGIYQKDQPVISSKFGSNAQQLNRRSFFRGCM